MQKGQSIYDDASVRYFMWAAFGWGILGLMAGLLLGAQSLFPSWNWLPELSFGRLRPLHTQLVLFALVGNLIFAVVYYSTQRLCRVRMASDGWSALHFWGWQTLTFGQTLTMALGWTQGRIYAEPEWPFDLAFIAVWGAFAMNFFRTLQRRQTPRLYVSLWFYVVCVVMVGIIHVANNLVFPIYGMRGYSLFAGVQDALIQEWYRNCLLSFFITAPMLGAMYYFLPKISGQPVYSHRLAIVHFWAFTFISPWVAPQFLLHTFLPVWAQSMGMLFSIMLWAPAWAGVLNGMLTLRGAWGRLRAEPALLFLVGAIAFYGWSVIEAPWMAIRSMSAWGLFTQWTSGYFHTLLMGATTLLLLGVMYWLVPRLYGTPLHSRRGMVFHFWTSATGVLFYSFATRSSAMIQATLWNELEVDGSPTFPLVGSTLPLLRPWMYLRLFAGIAFSAGFAAMCWNLWRTRANGTGSVEERVGVFEGAQKPANAGWRLVTGRPVVATAIVIGLILVYLRADPNIAVLVIALFCMTALLVWVFNTLALRGGKAEFHLQLESQPVVFAFLVFAAASVAPFALIVPLLWQDTTTEISPTEIPMASTTAAAPEASNAAATEFPIYRPLEIHGRAIYVREGCQYCHTRMVRAGTVDTARYGAASETAEYRYEHPYLGGTLRTGPDLHRIGNQRSEGQLFDSLVSANTLSSGTMPRYDWLLSETVQLSTTAQRMKEYARLGVPYTDTQIQAGFNDAVQHAKDISAKISAASSREISWRSEMVALIAYLKRNPQR